MVNRKQPSVIPPNQCYTAASEGYLLNFFFLLNHRFAKYITSAQKKKKKTASSGSSSFETFIGLFVYDSVLHGSSIIIMTCLYLLITTLTLLNEVKKVDKITHDRKFISGNYTWDSTCSHTSRAMCKTCNQNYQSL